MQKGEDASDKATPPATLSDIWNRMTVGIVCLTAGLTGLSSFVFLTVAIGTDYWYVIDVSNSRYNYGEDWEDLNSHSGLWRICEGKNACIALIDPFGEESQNVPESQHHLLGALTLAGILVYIAYSKAAFAIAMRLYGHTLFDNVHIGFSWSMGLACLSCVSEVIAGGLFLLAAKLAAVQHPEQSATI
ncbi:transmembrane protein 235-like isoform X2 [Scyliorhinus canicula]|uniref:transmembrane protein 235-like isoform X2 n=1 Tax=Scyliorhinus canicula TaxID=7830 RepID=UPI0018F2A12E|nr:transmembrane protein 235-like isoform X2 [Scyliorhinus canicula]